MVTAGVDAGARTVEVVLNRDGEVVGRALGWSGHAPTDMARALVVRALDEADLEGVDRVVVTGSWRERVGGHARITEVEAVSRGAVHLVPGVRTVIEVGAEEARALRLDEGGVLTDAVEAEACAAGAGTFAETVARLLGLHVEELGPLSLRSDRAAELSAQCVVFVEREALALVRDGVDPADIARAVHEGMASRVGSMVRRLGYEPPVALVGGVARNQGFVDALRRELQLQHLLVPEHPGHCAALGAALVAAEGGA